MRIRIDVFHHHGIEGREFAELKAGLTRILHEILSLEDRMTKELDNLTAEVTDIETQADSIIALCNGLSTQLADIKEDPVAIQALADSLKIKAQAIADAVAANTPPAV
jgi:hypothetical protein